MLGTTAFSSDSFLPLTASHFKAACEQVKKESAQKEAAFNPYSEEGG